MCRYKVLDYVETTKGIGQIEKIWSLNDKVTVFEVRMENSKKVNIFYGEILAVLNKNID